MSTSTIQRKEILGHPAGLFILFFTEMWERFSYYGMRAILVLYIISESTSDNPGLDWSKGDALKLYGWYTMLVYVMSIPGGVIADKYLGQKRTVFLGGIILCLGHGILAVEQMWAFYTGLVLIILGVGGLKPNISTMVGGLYEQGDVRRDKGFTIFYIGINIGAFLSSLIVGYVGETIGWHYGFGLAGIGMVLGQVVYMLGQKHLEGVGDLVKSNTNSIDKSGEATIGQLFANLFKSPLQLILTLIITIAGVTLSYLFAEGWERHAWAALATFIAAVAGMMMMIYKDIIKIDKDRFIVLLLSFIIVIVFWGAFEQAGGLMNIYTMEKIDRTIFGFEIPASVFQSVNAFFIMVFGTMIAGFWAKRQLKGKEASTLLKMAIGTMIMGLGFLMMSGAALDADSSEIGKGAVIWLILAYLLHTIGELCVSPTALSFITKLAPIKYVSIMMGVYFACTGFGNKVAGMVGESVESASELTIFTGIFIFTVLFGALLFLFFKKLKALTHGAEDLKKTSHHEEAEGFEIIDSEE